MRISKPKSFEETNIPPIMPHVVKPFTDSEGSVINVLPSDEVDIPDLGSVDPANTFGFAKYVNTQASLQDKTPSPITPMDALGAAALAGQIHEQISNSKKS